MSTTARTGRSREVREVGQDEVDAEVLVAREREPGVDDDALVAELEDGHVLADLAEPAERDDPKRVCHGPESTDDARRRNRRRSGSDRKRADQAEPLEAVADLRRLRRRRPRRAAAAGRRPRGRASWSAGLIAIGFVCTRRSSIAGRSSSSSAWAPLDVARRGSSRSAPSPAGRRRGCGRRCRPRRRPRGTGGSGRRRPA